ncbi:THO complex subunit 1-like isoform X2 [Rhodnius prolixus]|uniref:THO complex subunit 1-like isoform X2 n=1 Tax=Rhodnius prolixus TaxID=13249 RepID=UPI003D189F28
MTHTEKLPATFITMRTVFAEEFSKSLETGIIDNIRTKWQSLDAKDCECRIALEEAIRTKMLDMMVMDGDGHSSLDQDTIPYFLDTVLALCKKELLSPSLSVCLLSDLLDTSTVAKCEKIFDFVERHVATWKEPLFFSACKNNILRMCNDLLRRLSKTQHNNFSGRILLFLAMFFPFSERSGLNVVSEFNIDSFMKYDTEELKDDVDESMEIVDNSIKLDSTFYTKFWSLQEYFRSPNLCYNKPQWKEFVNNANTVLSVFKNFKLSSQENQDWCNSLSDRDDEEFITKFLTNQKLLLHQLEDSYFRRTIYIQFLILFQFLTAQIKTKQESNELKPDQIEWVKNATEKVHKLIRESPPDGEQFLANILQLLKRDEHWSRWKNEGCPALTKVMPNYDKPTFQNKPPTTTTCDWTNLGTILCRVKSTDKIIMPRADGPEVVDMKHDYLAFCKGRRTVPELNVYLKEAIQQSESPEYIDPNNKKVADKQFSWVALKLLSQKSPHFFSLNHTPISKLPDFVDHICRKIYREQNPGLLLPPLLPAPKTGSGGSAKADSTNKRASRSGTATNNVKDKTSSSSEQKSKSSSSNSTAPPAKIAKTSASSDKQMKSSSLEAKQNSSSSNLTKSTDKSTDKTVTSSSQVAQRSKDKVDKKEKTPEEKGKSIVQNSQTSKSKEKSQEKSKAEKVVKSHDKESSKSKKDKSPVKRKRSDDRENDEKRMSLSSGKKSKDRVL